MRVDPVVAKIDQAKAIWAEDALTRPGDKSEFGYGKAVGIQEGLRMARIIVLQDDADEKESMKHG